LFTFGILSGISLGQNYRKYLKGEFSFKDFVLSSGTEITVYGASCSTVGLFATTGG